LSQSDIELEVLEDAAYRAADQPVEILVRQARDEDAADLGDVDAAITIDNGAEI
jgi:hypothetical protein